MSDIAADISIGVSIALAGIGLFGIGWIVGHLDREKEYWRGRRDGREQYEAETRDQAARFGAACAEAESRAAVLRRLAAGVTVNEGDVFGA